MAEADNSEISIGSRVILSNKENTNDIGTLLWIGQIGDKPEPWYGVEVDEPKGKHNGSSKGIQYFKCKDKHGLFVRRNHIKLLTEGAQLEKSSVKKEEVPPVVTKPTNEILSSPSKKDLKEEAKEIEKPKETKEAKDNKNQKDPPSELKETKEKETKDVKDVGAKAKKEPVEKKKEPTATSTSTKTVAPSTEKGDKGPATKKATGATSKEDPSKKPAPVDSKKAGSGPGLKKTDTKTDNKGDTKAEGKGEAKAEGKGEAKAEVKADPKAEVKAEAKAETKVETKIEANTEKPEINPEQTATKQEPEEKKKSSGVEEKLPSSEKPRMDELSTNMTESVHIAANSDEQASYLSVQNEVPLYKLEIQKRERENEELLVRISALNKKISELESGRRTDDSSKMELLNLKITELESKLNFSEGKKGKIEAENKKMKEELLKNEEKINEYEKMVAMIEKLTFINEDLKITNETLKLENEEIQEELKKLREDHELISLELEEAMQTGGDLHFGNETNVEELRAINGKMQRAIEILNINFENEKASYEKQITRFKLALEKVPDLQAKAQELEEQKALIIKKDAMIEDLKLRLEESAEANDMIERLTDQIMRKEEDVIEYKRSIKELRENAEMDQQIIEEQEELNKQLQRDVDQREYEISLLRQKINEHDRITEEFERTFSKFRENKELMTKELEVMREQLSNTGEAERTKKIEDLFKKQVEMGNEKREIYKILIDYQLSNIKLNADALIFQIFSKAIPEAFLSKLRLDSFNKYLLTRSLRLKAEFLFKELITSYLQNKSKAKDDYAIIDWASKILIHLVDLTECCEMLEEIFKGCSDENKYNEFARNSLFSQLTAINIFIDGLFESMKDETISIKINLDSIKILLTKLIENVQTEAKGAVEQKAFIPSQIKSKLMKSLVYSNKVIATCHNKSITEESLEKTVNRLKGYLEKTSYRIEINDEYNLSEEESNIEALTHSSEFFDKISDDISDKNAGFPELLKKITDYLEQLPGKLNFNQKVKVDEVSKYESSKRYVPQGPWELGANNLKSEINKVLNTGESFEKLNNELNEQRKANMVLEKEMKEIKTIKETLDRRVAELQMKAERVTMLENERKRFQDRENHFTEATNKIKEELEEAERRNQELKTQLDEYESGVGPQASQPNFLQNPGVERRSFGKVRESLMPRMSLMGAGNIGLNLAELMKTSGAREDDLESLNIIQKLLLENTYLKSSNMRETLEKLNKTMPKFNIYMNKLKRKRVGADSEDILGISQISKLSRLQKDLKHALCERSIVDLSSIAENRIDSTKQYLMDESQDLRRIKFQAYEVASAIISKFKNNQENHFKPALDPEIQKSLKNVENLPLIAEIKPKATLGSSQTLRSKKTVMTMSEFLELKKKILVN